MNTGKSIRTALLLAVGLMLSLAAAGGVYQAIGTRADARSSPERGRLINADGLMLLLNCAGSGTPTVILESGLSDSSVGWESIQRDVAIHTRVCSYDRAGYGGSAAGPMPRTSAQIAKELHALLSAAGEKPPFVLAGHSFGGYNVRVYNGEYPNEVMGMVLIDSTQEDQYALLPSAWKKTGAEQLARYQSQARWAPFLVDLGYLRLRVSTNNWTSSPQGLPRWTYLILQGKALTARASELEFIQSSAEQARASGDLGEKPLIVLTAGKNNDEVLRKELSPQDFDAFQKVWVDELQMRLTHLSKRGERRIIDSGHDILSERPEAVVAAIGQVLTTVKGNQIQP